MDATTAGRDHDFFIKMPDRRTPPATAQPAPVMDRYNGLRLASNSYKISHTRKAATKRVTPHADRINTDHRSRVTLKGRFEGMDYVYRNRIRFILRKKRLFLIRVQCYLSEILIVPQSFLRQRGILERECLVDNWFKFPVHNKIHDLLEIV